MKKIILFITFFLLGFIGTVFSRRLYNASDFIYIDDNENTNVNDAILNINNIIKTKGKTEFLGSVNSIKDAEKYSELYAFSYYIEGSSNRVSSTNVTNMTNADYYQLYSYDSTESYSRLYRIKPKGNEITISYQSNKPDRFLVIGVLK